jgi:hypothetical protein
MQMRSNSGLLQTGATLTVALTRLEGSLVTSLIHVAAGKEVARCRTLGRYAARLATANR